MISFILLFLISLVCLAVTTCVVNPFVFICHVTLISVCLGLLLLANGFSFAGAVLIIVNAGAIAMVFLFVCVLGARSHVIQRRFDAVKTVFLVSFIFGSGLFSFYAYSTLVSTVVFKLADDNGVSFDSKTHVNDFFSSVNSQQSFLLESSLPDDFSLASHILLLDKNGSFFGFLPLLGTMLVVAMVIAILVTQRTKNLEPQKDHVLTSFWSRRWTWDRGTAIAPGLEPRTKFNLFKWH